MVMLLLNLAIIPDEVCKKIDFSPGWSERFKNLMKEYREKWDMEVDMSQEDYENAPEYNLRRPKKTLKWDFQNNELEEKYQKFVIAQYETDLKLHADTIEF